MGKNLKTKGVTATAVKVFNRLNHSATISNGDDRIRTCDSNENFNEVTACQRTSHPIIFREQIYVYRITMKSYYGRLIYLQNTFSCHCF